MLIFGPLVRPRTSADTNMARGTRADAQVYGSAHRRVKPGQLPVETSAAASPVPLSPASPCCCAALPRPRLLRRRLVPLRPDPFCSAVSASTCSGTTLVAATPASGNPVASGLTDWSPAADTG